MSTVDPELRWWRNPRLLRVIALVLWCVVFLSAFITGWSNALYLAGARWESWAGAEWLVGVEGVTEPVRRAAETSMVFFLWPVLVAGLVDGWARARAGTGAAWAIASAIGWTSLGLGLGSFTAVFVGPVPWGLPVLLVVIGALALAVRPVTRHLLSARGDRQAWSRQHGALANGVATKVDVETVGGVDRWRVTVRYEDGAGQTRWHAVSIAFREFVTPRAGDRYEVRYDPAHPGRRSSIYVDLIAAERRRGR